MRLLYIDNNRWCEQMASADRMREQFRNGLEAAA